MLNKSPLYLPWFLLFQFLIRIAQKWLVWQSSIIWDLSNISKLFLFPIFKWWNSAGLVKLIS
jgi:hypothetical protein